MTEHTPGPWKVDTSYQWPSKVSSTVAPYDEGWICDCSSGRRGSMEMARSLANARLIAAAPELLEALEELVDLVNSFLKGEYIPDSFTTQPGENAIAKAKGEEHD